MLIEATATGGELHFEGTKTLGTVFLLVEKILLFSIEEGRYSDCRVLLLEGVDNQLVMEDIERELVDLAELLFVSREDFRQVDFMVDENDPLRFVWIH